MSVHDVAVIGCGVTGAFIARALSRCRIRTVVIERGPDACSGTSRANSGVVHAGFYSMPGTLKAELCVEGNRRYAALCSELGVPYRRCGKMVVALDDGKGSRDGAAMGELESLLARGREVGTRGLEIVDGETARRMEPNVPAAAALHSPDSAIVSPYATTIAAAEDAAVNGVRFILGTAVTDVAPKDDGFRLGLTGGGEVTARLVVNAAGISSARVASMFGLGDYTVYPVRGEYLLMDKAVGHLISRMVYVASAGEGEATLGVHLTPTVEGHILVGPTAEYVDEPDVATTAPRARQMLEEARAILPALRPRDVIKAFAGLRARLVPEGATARYGEVDFVIEEEPTGVVHLLGIESPGLTAAPILAERIVADLVGRLEAVRKEHTVPYRWLYATPGIREGDGIGAARAAAVARDPDRGLVVCRCEHATRADVLRALDNPLGATGLNAVKFRTRAMMGRCQGGFCVPRIADILVRERGLRPEEVRQGGPGSHLFTGFVKTPPARGDAPRSPDGMADGGGGDAGMDTPGGDLR